MQAFEHVCKIALEQEDFVVASNVKFPITMKTKRKDRKEYQTHGYEVDLIGARRNRLVLAEVKSFFGSRGVNLQGFRGLADASKTTYFKRYKIFNDYILRRRIVEQAANRYGYKVDQVELRLYVGNFRNENCRIKIEKHLAEKQTKVIGLSEVVELLLDVSKSKTYTDDPVVMTIKALSAAGVIDQSYGVPEILDDEFENDEEE